ncbi:MAG: DMT family transporter [Chitinophagaceae bacterium]|nr:DMT family transporter [Chitinophagaceae bacterium]
MIKRHNRWIVYSIVAALFWGVWGVIAKLIAEDINPYTNHFLFSCGMLVTVPFVFRKCVAVKPKARGIGWGLIAGILAIAGNIAVYNSFASGGMAAIVIPVTNLYPMITIAIAISFFKEKLNWVNAAGILLAIPAVIILSGESLLFDKPSVFFQNFTFNAWLLFALVALFFWGVFSAAQKVTTNYISAEWSYMIFIFSSLLIAIAFWFAGLINFDFKAGTLWLGILAGMLNGLGVLASFAAYSAEGKASKVTTIAGSLQPVFTILLAYAFLSENLTLLEMTGILLAIFAALALSYEKPKPTGATNIAPLQIK